MGKNIAITQANSIIPFRVAVMWKDVKYVL
jgi:hypothetical protein